MTNLYNRNYPLQMPLSCGTVTTPYDSRMLDKHDELQARIVARSKRNMKARNKILRTKRVTQTPKYIEIASFSLLVTLVTIASTLFIVSALHNLNLV